MERNIPGHRGTEGRDAGRELPKWNNWLAIADEADAPPPDPERGHRSETMRGIRLGAAPAAAPPFTPPPSPRMTPTTAPRPAARPAPEHPPARTPAPAPEPAPPQETSEPEGPRYRHVALRGDGGMAPPALRPLSEAPGNIEGRIEGRIEGDGDATAPPRPVEPPLPPAPLSFEPDAIEGDGFTGVDFHGPPRFEGPPAPPPRPAPPPDLPVAPEAPASPLSGDGMEQDEPFFFAEASELAPRPAAPRPPAVEVGDGEVFSAIDLRDRVVIMLLFKQVIRIEQIEGTWRRWKKMVAGGSKEPLWRILAQDAALDVDREGIYAEAAQVYAFKEAQVNHAAVLKYLRDKKNTFTEAQWEQMRKLHVLPVTEEKLPEGKAKRILFVAFDPTHPEINRLLGELKLDSFELQYLPESQISAIIAEAFPKKNEFLERMSEDPMAFDLGTTYEQGKDLIDEDALEAEINRSSLINLFEASLVEAVRNGASDIHIFPNARRQIEIHFRVDGDLNRWHVEERVHPEAFLAVVKDNTGNVDRFERDAAQDGFVQRWVDDTLIRYRVSVLPIANANQEVRAESIVIRVLDDRKVVTDLDKLGLLERAMERFDWAIRQPHGMVILTGPTGSGKSTTLFAALHQVVTPKRNVLTIEDPVEYIIPGVRQIKLNHKLDLEQAIRAILRHDPDIVMVGEMRDRPTADLAIKLANTGHLTFSTLHTNDASSAVSRLYKMGVEPFLIAYAINLIVAQRLIRKLCPACRRVERDHDPETLRRLGFSDAEVATTTFYEEGHDPKCQTCRGAGYKGRRAITETMIFSKEIRRLIVTANEMIDEDAIREAAVRDGMLTLRDSAREYVKRGETSVLEMIRVTAGEH